MPSQKREKDHPPRSAGQRVIALEERLADLRSQLDGRMTPLPPAASGPRKSDIDRLALLVFNTLKGDSAKLRQLVHALGQLEAAKTKKPGK